MFSRAEINVLIRNIEAREGEADVGKRRPPLPVYFLRQSLEGEPGNKRCTVHSLNGAL